MLSATRKMIRKFIGSWFLMLLGPAAVLLSVEQASPQLSLSTGQSYTETAEEAKENKQPDADNEDETELMSMSLEELMNVSVVTASKKAEPIDEAPNVMYVITKEQIRKRGYRTLKDIFQIIPGFGVFHKDIQFVSQVRGIAPNDNEKIAFMINGHIINQLTEPEVFSGGVILLDIFDRIEVIVGPGAVLYGGEPLVAIVNMITKKQDYNEIIASAGNFDDYSSTLMFGKQWEEKKNFFAAGTWSKRDGFDAWLDDSPSTRNQNLADMPSITGKRYPSFVFFGQGEYDDWSAQFFTQNSQMPELHMEGNLAGDDCRRSDYIYSTVIRNKKQWTDNLSSSFKLFGDLKRVRRSIDEVGSGSGEYFNLDLSQTSYGAEYAFQHKTDKNFFQAGLQYQLNQHRHNYDFQWKPDDPYGYEDDYMRSIVSIEDTHAEGLYLSDDYWLITDTLKLVGAVRFDRNNILNTNKIYTSPRAAVVYKPTKPWTVKLMYNKATRLALPPWGTSLNNLWGSDKPEAPSWASVNPNAEKPEELTTIELQNILYLGKSRVSFNIYRQKLENFYSWFSPFTNVGEFEGTGFELDAAIRLTDNFSVWGNAAFSDNDFTITAQPDKAGEGEVEEIAQFQLPANDKGESVAVPKYTANIGFDWEVIKNLNLSSTVRYFTRQPMFRSDGWAYADNRTYLDATLTWENFLTEDLDLRFIAKNILNNRKPVGTQWLTDAYKPRGTTFLLSVFYRF